MSFWPDMPSLQPGQLQRGLQAPAVTYGPGTRLGHYEVAAPLGAGGMGEVYRARDTKLGRDIALKVLPATMVRDPERLARFQREAKALAALDTSGVVTVYSVEEVDGVHFLTMQLVEGRSLDAVIPAGGIPPERFIEIASALAEALAVAHEKGIVHRDLKPANVMVAHDGRVKVLDFGLAKEVHAPGSADATATVAGHTRAGVVMGTPAYMSPEQIEGRPVGAASDIFSLGVVLYEMATGRRPFQGDSAPALMSSILRDRPPLPRRPAAASRGRLTTWSAPVLNKDAALRPSATTLRDRLRRFHDPTRRSGSPPFTRPRARSRRVRPHRGRRNAGVDRRGPQPDGVVRSCGVHGVHGQGASYSGERLTALLYLPRSARPPYQVVIQMAGAATFYRQSSATERDIFGWGYAEYLLRGGRAVMIPLWKGSYERSDGFHPLETEWPSYREHVVQWVTELHQSVDYLESRDDIDAGRIGYQGVSNGVLWAPLFLALEPRIRSGILLLGGLLVKELHSTPMRAGNRRIQLRAAGETIGRMKALSADSPA